MSLQQTEKINFEKQNPEDEIEELETQSVDGSSSAEAIMNSSIASETNDVFSNQTINDVRLKLQGLNTRQLPSWDHNKKKRESIKEHLQMAKELGNRLEWSDKELANEVMLSLRGESGTIARQFPQDIQNNFKLLERELMKFFWVPKPKSQMLKEFNNLAWNPDRQKLQQYAVTLRGKLLKIFRGDTEEFNLKLRDRFIEAIKEVRPEFGRTFEMLDLEQKTEFWNLATYAQRKYDLYQNSTERIEEEQVLLCRDLYAEETEKEMTANQCREWNTYPTQKQQIYQPVDIQSDMIDKECDYPCNRYQPDYGQDWQEETRNGTMYGYDDLNEERFENLLSRYDEQDFPSDLTEIQLRNKHELTKATGEFDDYRELYNAERYQYYDSNQQFIHPRKHDSFAPNDQYCSQENDSNQYL